MQSPKTVRTVDIPLLAIMACPACECAKPAGKDTVMALALQTDCMVIVLAPNGEAVRLPRVRPVALGYGLPTCDNKHCLEGCVPKVR